MSRVDYKKVAPDAVKAILNLEGYVQKSSLDKNLLELIKLRASQLNGCAYCVDMHTQEAKKLNIDERKLHAVSVWHESSFFTPRERAALAWTEAVTLLHETKVPEDIYQEALKEFGEAELVDLTMAIITINSWNRLAVSFRVEPRAL